MIPDKNSSRGDDKALQARLAREAEFHDAKYSGDDTVPRHYSVMPTQYVQQRMSRSIGDISGKKVLEYGCGEGWFTRELASRGAEVYAFDISDQSITETRRVVERAGLSASCHLQVMSAERMNYPDDSFDIAVGFAIIHHLDLTQAFAELHRVLRPGGVAYFAEPLGSNPLIQLYRRLTPRFRTRDERPLFLHELPKILSQFRGYSHSEYYVAALGAVALAYIPGGQRLFPAISAKLHRIDEAMMKRFPELGRYAWYTVLTIYK